MPFLRRQDRQAYDAAVRDWNNGARAGDEVPPNRGDYGWYVNEADREPARERRNARIAREREAERVRHAEIALNIPPIGARADNMWAQAARDPNRWWAEPPPAAPLEPAAPVDAVAMAENNQALADMIARVGMPAARAPRMRDPDMANNRQYLKDYPRLDLDKIPDGPRILRTVSLPPFKVDYDSHEQIQTKLRGSIIMVKDNPFHVVETIDAADGFALLVRDHRGTTSWLMYDEVKDFRGIAPGYVNYQNSAYWLYRVPERQNRQGMTNANTHSRLVGTEYVQGARNDFLLGALSTRTDIKFASNLVSLLEAGALSSIRLSNEIALYRSKTKGAACGVEYLGRKMGLIVKDQVKVFDEHDLMPSWINKDFMDVNLQLTA